MDNLFMEKYARLVVETGINIQKDQILVINSPIECAGFTRVIARAAYDAGARDVVINWKDELFSKIRYMKAPEAVFDEFPEWQKEFYNSYGRKGAAFLSIAASDPELMKDVDPGRIARDMKTKNIALEEHSTRIMTNKNAWCVVSVPTKAWARKVFPGVSEDEAVGKLWDAILKAVRVDTEDPVASWEQHKTNLSKRTGFLNANQFKYLIYRNSLGTDLKIELPENHFWVAGSEKTPEGIEFMANMPTEEAFTLPKKTGVNGKVVSSLPLNYNGNLIEEFSITFKEGRIVDFTAKNGYEALRNLIETDEGSHYLGEVALVPYDSPISNSRILFYNTLFDENASCHLAIGRAYPCIKGVENMDEKQLEALGVNNSLEHVDFMIGTADLEIMGVTPDGKEIPVFRQGNFADVE